MLIQFDGEYKWDIDSGSVKFAARVDGKRVISRISEETLQDCFDSEASRDAYEQAFVANRSAIEARAADKIRRGDVNDKGGADLRTLDFPELASGHFRSR